MKTKSKRLSAGILGAMAVGLALACERGSSPSAPSTSQAGGFSASASPAASAAHVRWDIVSVVPPNVSAGGIAQAKANDGSQITLSGSGTFVAPAGGGGTSSAVTGGGTWATSGPIGGVSGAYEVTGLVRWEQAPGTFPAINDQIGSAADAHAGLVVLRIAYDDGSHGILVVSCNLVGTPIHVFEGVTASKGFTDFWNRVAPVAGVNANRTVFHVLD